MPKRYEAIKRACMERGGSEDDCQELAARIYNETRKPGEPSLAAYVKKEKRSGGKP